jgi:hypothetical protein
MNILKLNYGIPFMFKFRIESLKNTYLVNKID